MRIPKNAETLTRAVNLATKHHTGQFRRYYPLPYVTHCYAVAHRLAGWGITDDHPYVIECALLHDVIEDSEHPNLAVDEIRSNLGEQYLNICIELTFVPKCGVDDYPVGEQKAEYLASFAGKSVESIVVKVADRLSNTEDFEVADGSSPGKYQRKYLTKASRLFTVLGQRRPEVEATFGGSFYARMAADVIRIHEMLGVECPALF